jgi:hypothetical protein
MSQSRNPPVRTGIHQGRGVAASGVASALANAPTAASGDCLSRQVIEFGYDKNIEEKYELGRELGKV